MTDSQLALLARSRQAKRHTHSFLMADWTPYAGDYDDPERYAIQVCTGCGIQLSQYEARQRRGKRSLRAGKDAERTIAKAYGGTRVGQFGGASDVVIGELFSVQSKAGGWFSERMWSELQKLPRTGGRIPTLIVSERPKSGVHARRLVIRLYEDDVALHGEKP